MHFLFLLVFGVVLTLVIEAFCVFLLVKKLKKLTSSRNIAPEKKEVDASSRLKDMLNEGFYKTTETQWLNLILMRYFLEARKSEIFKTHIKNMIYKKFEFIKNSNIITSIVVQNMHFGDDFLHVNSIEPLKVDQKDNTDYSFFDMQTFRINIDYFGGFMLQLELTTKGNIHLDVKIKLLPFSSDVLFRLPAFKYNSCFEFSFPTDPNLKFEIEAHVSRNKRVLMKDVVVSLLHKVLKSEIKKRIIYPKWLYTHMPLMYTSQKLQLMITKHGMVEDTRGVFELIEKEFMQIVNADYRLNSLEGAIKMYTSEKSVTGFMSSVTKIVVPHNGQKEIGLLLEEHFVDCFQVEIHTMRCLQEFAHDRFLFVVETRNKKDYLYKLLLKNGVVYQRVHSSDVFGYSVSEKGIEVISFTIGIPYMKFSIGRGLKLNSVINRQHKRIQDDFLKSATKDWCSEKEGSRTKPNFSIISLLMDDSSLFSRYGLDDAGERFRVSVKHPSLWEFLQTPQWRFFLYDIGASVLTRKEVHEYTVYQVESLSHFRINEFIDESRKVLIDYVQTRLWRYRCAYRIEEDGLAIYATKGLITNQRYSFLRSAIKRWCASAMASSLVKTRPQELVSLKKNFKNEGLSTNSSLVLHLYANLPSLVRLEIESGSTLSEHMGYSIINCETEAVRPVRLEHYLKGKQRVHTSIIPLINKDPHLKLKSVFLDKKMTPYYELTVYIRCDKSYEHAIIVENSGWLFWRVQYSKNTTVCLKPLNKFLSYAKMPFGALLVPKGTYWLQIKNNSDECLNIDYMLGISQKRITIDTERNKYT